MKNLSNKFSVKMVAIVALTVVVFGLYGIAVPTAKHAFGFNTRDVSGFPGGGVQLTGGGVYDLSTAIVNSAGGFRCSSNVLQGPLSGCLAGQGVRWDTAALLTSTPFKCTGAAGEQLKVANTGAATVVLVADFYRQGDGNEESFTGKMIVSQTDLAPELAGIQNVWIQGVGCGSAIVNFN
jgi:hypothetical protein